MAAFPWYDSNWLATYVEARDLKPAQLELHEAREFGRFIVHDHPYFTELQRSLVDLAGITDRYEAAP